MYMYRNVYTYETICKRGINMSIFRVAIHYGVNSNGVFSYDTDNKNRNGGST